MKKLLTLSMTLVLFVVLSACGNYATNKNPVDSTTNQQNNQTTTITRERALEIALEKAGVKQEDIRDLDIELDLERGGKVWEVDFDHGTLEYSYDVDAETGAITKARREIDF